MLGICYGMQLLARELGGRVEGAEVGEFGRSGKGGQLGLAWALTDIFTLENGAIALIAALIGYVVVEFLRSKF